MLNYKARLLRNRCQIAARIGNLALVGATRKDNWGGREGKRRRSWGAANLYHLQLQFRVKDDVSDSQAIDFGIRKITQHRDSDTSFPAVGTGGNFYLQVNGQDYLIRGAAYTPDLLFKNAPQRDAAIMLYSKDLGLNMLRWELKIADDTNPSARNGSKVPESPLVNPGAPQKSEDVKNPQPPGTPYKPYAEPSGPGPTYKPYAEMPVPERPYEP